MKITYDYFKSLSKEELSKEEHKDFQSIFLVYSPLLFVTK
jgi:hypothetical protein